MRRSLAALAGIALLAGSAAPGLASPGRALKAPLTFTGELVGDEAGHQIEVADLDGDGQDDLVIGAWLNDEGGEDTGAIYVEYGPLTKSVNLAKADAKLFTPAVGDYVGEGPLGVTDLDGDGADDLILGAPGAFYVLQPASPGKIGEAFLLYGGKRLRGKHELPTLADARFTGLHMTEWLGFGSSGVGDLDDDGFEDLLVGAPATAGFSGTGYLFYGAKKRLKGDVPVTGADAILVGGRAGDMFGYEATGGDVDGDGDDDLFVASKPIAGGPAAVTMFQGGDRLSGVLPAAAGYWQEFMPTVDYFSGPALAAGEDLTGDGTDDLVVGLSPYLNPVGPLTTYVFGGEGAFAAGPHTGSGRSSVPGAGAAVAIGDLNGDGKADLVTGDPSEGGGVAYVFHGPIAEGELTLDAADARFEGPLTDGGAGSALAFGHLDRNRRGDLAVGAPWDGAGVTHVVLGGR